MLPLKFASNFRWLHFTKRSLISQDLFTLAIIDELNERMFLISTVMERIKAVEDITDHIMANLVDMGIDFEVDILVANIGIASMLLIAKPSIAINTSFK